MQTLVTYFIKHPDDSETLWNEAKQQSQTMFITIISDSLSLDEDIVQHSPLISRRIYFVKFPVNLLKPNPQSEASILSSVHLRGGNPIFSWDLSNFFLSSSNGNGLLFCRNWPKRETSSPKFILESRSGNLLFSHHLSNSLLSCASDFVNISPIHIKENPIYTRSFIEFFCSSISARKFTMLGKIQNNAKIGIISSKPKIWYHILRILCMTAYMWYLICVVSMLAKWPMNILAWIYVLQRYLW